jgi:hypothetical protein
MAMQGFGKRFGATEMQKRMYVAKKLAKPLPDVAETRAAPTPALAALLAEADRIGAFLQVWRVRCWRLAVPARACDRLLLCVVAVLPR